MNGSANSDSRVPDNGKVLSENPILVAAEERALLAAYRKKYPKVCASYKAKTRRNVAKAMVQLRFITYAKRKENKVVEISQSNLETHRLTTEVEQMRRLKEQIAMYQKAWAMIERNKN